MRVLGTSAREVPGESFPWWALRRQRSPIPIVVVECWRGFGPIRPGRGLDCPGRREPHPILQIDRHTHEQPVCFSSFCSHDGSRTHGGRGPMLVVARSPHRPLSGHCPKAPRDAVVVIPGATPALCTGRHSDQWMADPECSRHTTLSCSINVPIS